MKQLSRNEGVYMQTRRRLAEPQVIRTAASTYAIGIARGKCGRVRFISGTSTLPMYWRNQRYPICGQRRRVSLVYGKSSRNKDRARGKTNSFFSSNEIYIYIYIICEKDENAWRKFASVRFYQSKDKYKVKGIDYERFPRLETFLRDMKQRTVGSKSFTR